MLPYLRYDLPTSYGFTVSQADYTAKLDQNEAPVDLSPELKARFSAEVAARPWNRYVQPAEYVEAKNILARELGVPADNVVITCGADQGLEAAFIIAGGSGRTARWFEPTYPYISHLALRTHTKADPYLVGVSLAELSAAELAGDYDVVFLVSPNNPTGQVVTRDVVRAACRRRERLVVVDEAYSDFAEHSVIDLVAEHDNLLVVRSMSKALLASVHVGYAVGHVQAIAAIERMLTAPYHLNWIQLVAARLYPEIRAEVKEVAGTVVSERRRVRDALSAMDGVEAYDGDGNFVLFRVGGGRDASAVAAALAERGIRIRDVSKLPCLEGHLRVTIGTRDENDAFLTALSVVTKMSVL